ncbi:MAG: DUF192 domain-containing protein, partial [Gemmatimonadetes bacterium]|nr:DUF192 domain-containing protein [Gemmatimonadota bacterium]
RQMCIRDRVGAVAAMVAACGGVAGTNAVAEPAAAAQEVGPRPDSGLAWVIFGSDTVLAEVASLPEERAQGLMNRDSVPDGTGMLFVFPTVEERSFWMKDTRVSLDVAFFDEAYRVIGIIQLEALDETVVDSGTPTAFALEVRKGWFGDRGIEAGAMAKVVFGPGMTVR